MIELFTNLITVHVDNCSNPTKVKKDKGMIPFDLTQHS